MTKDEDRKYTIGCIAIVAIIFGLVWVTSDPNAGKAEQASYEACVNARQARFERRNPDASMSDEQLGDMVAACSNLAKTQNSN